MKLEIPEEWRVLLTEELNKPYFKDLTTAVVNKYDTEVCYPPKSLLFNALECCKPSDIKVVIIGQDPYHGEGQANGLAFSIADYVKHPPSLVNIFREITTDLEVAYPLSGNLEAWAKQGVLLLNVSLSVTKGIPNSHAALGWVNFTDALIQLIAAQNNSVVFMLWGGFAHKKEKLINSTKHLILKTGHPSPLSANKGKWFGNKHFSKANTWLIAQQKSPIEWDLNKL